MSGRSRRSEISRDKKEDAVPPAEIGGKIPWRGKDVDSSFRGDSSPNDSFDLPYRGRDRGVGRSGSMGRERDRSRSPNRSRSRDRGRDWESTRARSRSPFCDNRQESWSRRSDYSGGSRYDGNRNSADRSRSRGSDGYKKDCGLDDIAKEAYVCKDFVKGRCHRGASCRFPHHLASRDDRNIYNDQDRRHQLYQNSRPPCKFFSVGKCNRDDCKFSHDDPELGRYDGRSHDNNRTWDDRRPRDDLNKSWNGPTWDDVERSGGFNERSRDELGFSDVPKSKHSSDDKKNSWDGPSRDDINKSWNGPTWNDVERSGGFFERSRDESGFSDVPKSKHNSDDKKRSWDGPSWDDANASSGYPNVGKSNPNLDNKNRPWDGPLWEDVKASDHDSKNSLNDAKSSNNLDGKPKPWNGRLWDEVSESGYANAGKSCLGDGGSAGMFQPDSKIRKLDGPRWNEKIPEKNDNLLPQQMSVANGPVGGMFLHKDSCNQAEIQKREGGKPLGASETDVQRVMSSVNETNVISEQIPQLNAIPASLPELNLANAIDFLKSLPNSASSIPMTFQNNQDSRPKEQYDSAMEVSKSVKTSVPIGILSGLARQENQMPRERFPPPSTAGPNPSKLGEIGVVEKEQENINPEKTKAEDKVEEGNIGNDEKAMRQFKIALVEFVKEILKPTWKEGKMSRDDHKTILKKVVDKVTSTIQGNQIPRTQARIEQYLSFSKSKITKLVEAYVERFMKA